MPQAENKSSSTIRKRSKGTSPLDIVVFLIPCLQFIKIGLIGVLNGSDFFFIAVFLYLGFRGEIRIRTPIARRFMVLCSLWLVSQIVTDIVRRSAFTDYARGWSNIGMTLVNFSVLWALLYGRPRRLVLYGWGLITGSMLAFAFNRSEFAATYPWKFGIAAPVTWAVFFLVSSEKCRGHWPITLSTMIGVINICLGARSQGGVCLAAALYLLVTSILRRKRTESSKLKAGTVLALAASIILGSVGIIWSYQYAAGAGILGEKAKLEYDEQSSGKFGVLLGGRRELLGSLPAIYDSPILGHGSWAKGRIYLILEIKSELSLGYKHALEISRDDLREGLIPAHSYLFAAWVDAGILGAVFWGWVFVFTAKALMEVYPPTIVLLPVASLVAFSLMWEILFSPYGAEVRLIFPYYVTMLATCSNFAPKKVARVAPKVARKQILAASPSQP